MVEESVLRSLVKALDDGNTAAPSSAAIKAILEQEEHKAPVVATLAGMVPELVSDSGKQLALGILQPYAPNVPECIDLALALSSEEAWSLRQSAASFLAAISTDVKARARLFELLEDPVTDVRIVAINATAKMDHTGLPEGAATALYVVSDPDQREDALEILDELGRAVKTLQDLGDLSDGQNEIVDDLILPDIEELKQLLGSEYESFEAVVPQRKRSLMTLSGVIRTAQAFALGATGIANVDEAAANVKKAAELLLPVVEAVKDSI